MGRKRLMTILAGAVAAVGLHMGPAAALDLEATLSDGLFDGVDAKIVEQCEGEDTVALIESCIEKLEKSASDTTSKVEDTTSSTTTKTKDTAEKTTKKVEETTKKVEETATSTTGGGGDTSSTTKERSTSGGSDDGARDSGSSNSSGNNVSTASGARSAQQAERPDALSPEEARQFLAASRQSMDMPSAGGQVTPAFDLSGASFGANLEDPLVASPGTMPSEDVDNEWHAASPETAPSRSDAELAAIPVEPGGDVPAGLKLIAGLLVAGTGTLWHLTRRELSPAKA